jgi:hypothetical protein
MPTAAIFKPTLPVKALVSVSRLAGPASAKLRALDFGFVLVVLPLRGALDVGRSGQFEKPPGVSLRGFSFAAALQR